MKEKLLQLIEQLKSDKRLISFDEASTKQAVILRILSLIGWDTFNIDEVVPEYSIGGGRKLIFHYVIQTQTKHLLR